MLPANVLRPTPDHHDSAWGDRAIPDHFGGTSLEIGQLLKLERLGACISTLMPKKRSCPLHYHTVEEELFYVLAGPITVRELAEGADDYTEYQLQTGDLVVYPPGTHLAHQSHNRADHDVRYLCLSSARAPGEIAFYPDSGKTLVRGIGIGVFGQPSHAHIAAARATAGQRPARRLSAEERPAWVAGSDQVDERELSSGIFGRQLARSAGATEVFLNVDRLTVGTVSGPLHWHTQDEELVVVQSGHPVLRQRVGGVDQLVELQPGDIVAFHAGDEVAHQFIAKADDVELLVIGTDRADDVTVFVELDRIHVRALRRTGTLHRTDYFAGEG